MDGLISDFLVVWLLRLLECFDFISIGWLFGLLSCFD